MGRMNLRELINRLEELSEDGKNDDMKVLTDDNWVVDNAYIIRNKYVRLET